MMNKLVKEEIIKKDEMSIIRFICLRNFLNMLLYDCDYNITSEHIDNGEKFCIFLDEFIEESKNNLEQFKKMKF